MYSLSNETCQSDTLALPDAYIQWQDNEATSEFSDDKMPEYRGGYLALRELLLKELNELFIQFDRQQKNGFESKLYVHMDVDSTGKTSAHFTMYVYGKDELTDKCILTFFKNLTFQKPALRDSRPIAVKLSIPLYIQYPGNVFTVEPLSYPQGDSIWIYRVPLSDTDSLKRSNTDTTLYYFRVKLNEAGEITEYKLKHISGIKKRKELLYAKRMIKSIHHFRNPDFEPFSEDTKRELLFRFENNRIETIILRPGPQF